eukprot:CAMPEP_0174352098 /NCGR_PEP_ID=MMETSP0811_2-20130205/9643_1 /TAXON_ID=73025 ORGANISM="Eutreptiella gymnastica-like, Strain CCMP1594" /NCGR_SAMPLE_ID=MMETSP0811_2 /ASSEMBLY_ACC=CAM_ASM_000667 /LENGTH=63 /DNA_ID=CAMNT_0015481953 /DNA_START=464 /DNA_END=655 /DNA_ORIENTATION=-
MPADSRPVHKGPVWRLSHPGLATPISPSEVRKRMPMYSSMGWDPGPELNSRVNCVKILDTRSH